MKLRSEESLLWNSDVEIYKRMNLFINLKYVDKDCISSIQLYCILSYLSLRYTHIKLFNKFSYLHTLPHSTRIGWHLAAISTLWRVAMCRHYSNVFVYSVYVLKFVSAYSTWTLCLNLRKCYIPSADALFFRQVILLLNSQIIFCWYNCKKSICGITLYKFRAAKCP